MKKKEKGQYGYINYYKKGKLLVTLILAIMIASIILSMLLAFGDTGRIGIVFAILLVLPFAKFLIAYIMCARFQTMPQDVYDIVHGQTNETDMIYDLVITQTEGMHFYDAVCVRRNTRHSCNRHLQTASTNILSICTLIQTPLQKRFTPSANRMIKQK